MDIAYLCSGGPLDGQRMYLHEGHRLEHEEAGQIHRYESVLGERQPTLLYVGVIFEIDRELERMTARLVQKAFDDIRDNLARDDL
jgi:hypothetical protein